MTHSRPFRLYAQSELRALADDVQELLQPWLKDWLGETVELKVQAKDLGSRLMPASAHVWQAFLGGGDWLVAIDQCPDGLKALATGIAPKGLKNTEVRLPLSPVVAGIVEDAQRELAQALAGEPVHADREESADLPDYRRTGCGAALLELAVGEGTVYCLLSQSRVARLLRLRPNPVVRDPIRPVLPALTSKKTTIKLVLGHAEISLAELTSLRAGDVLTLDKKLEQPFSVCSVTTGEEIARANIGKKNGRIAASITGNN